MIQNSLFLATFTLLLTSSFAIRIIHVKAPSYINGVKCENSEKEPSYIHVAMTLDSKYLRGTMAAVNSILKHSDCPENLQFHFIAATSAAASRLSKVVESAFPSLPFKVYPFEKNKKIKTLISHSVRAALEDPLNYARIYLPEILGPCIKRVVYLDSDTIVVDEIKSLSLTTLPGSRVIAAPVYCQVDFKKYFNEGFWSDPGLSGVFEGKKPCYFNTGVMVIDLERWRRGGYTSKIEGWMEVQKERRIYELGSLPPFMLVFGGEIEEVDHRWNQHGLGGDNVEDSCRALHPGRVSLMHWSGKGKPWVRLDEGRPCPVDHLWAPYDLHTI